jgi:hypothetical protein
MDKIKSTLITDMGHITQLGKVQINRIFLKDIRVDFITANGGIKSKSRFFSFDIDSIGLGDD